MPQIAKQRKTAKREIPEIPERTKLTWKSKSKKGFSRSQHGGLPFFTRKGNRGEIKKREIFDVFENEKSVKKGYHTRRFNKFRNEFIGIRVLLKMARRNINQVIKKDLNEFENAEEIFKWIFRFIVLNYFNNYDIQQQNKELTKQDVIEYINNVYEIMKKDVIENSDVNDNNFSTAKTLFQNHFKFHFDAIKDFKDFEEKIKELKFTDHHVFNNFCDYLLNDLKSPQTFFLVFVNTALAIFFLLGFILFVFLFKLAYLEDLERKRNGPYATTMNTVSSVELFFTFLGKTKFGNNFVMFTIMIILLGSFLFSLRNTLKNSSQTTRQFRLDFLRDMFRNLQKEGNVSSVTMFVDLQQFVDDSLNVLSSFIPEGLYAGIMNFLENFNVFKGFETNHDLNTNYL